MVLSLADLRGPRIIVGLSLLGSLLVTFAGSVRSAPDPDAAVRALVSGPLAVVGDLAGGAGLIGAAMLGTAGDLASFADANRITRPVLRGAFSRGLHRLALGTSWVATGLLEGLRAEDVERLPEAPAAYLEAGPGLGRLDTGLDGLRTLQLGVGDTFATPARVVLHLVGARETAERVETWRTSARLEALGPLAGEFDETD